MGEVQISTGVVQKKVSFLEKVKKDFIRNKWIYLMAVPMIVYFIVFCYMPMYGVIIAFKSYSIKLGILGSKWVGLKYFKEFFSDYYFVRLLKNTLLMSLYDLFWGFPAPIILALLLNELRGNIFKRTVQTVTYIPHFISSVVICGMIVDFTRTDGLINHFLNIFGIHSSNLLARPELFRTINISSGIWQSIGWGSIIYLSALTAIDTALYEAATIDGAGRWKQLWHITLPGIMPTIIILFILRVGSLMSVGTEKILLLYSPLTYSTADVIGTFVYRKGLLSMQYSYSTAVGLFESVVGFILLIFANKISKKFTENSLW